MSSNLGINDRSGVQLVENESLTLNKPGDRLLNDNIDSNEIEKCNTQMEDTTPAVKTSNDLITESLSHENDPVIEDISDDNSNIRHHSGNIDLVEITTDVVHVDLTAENNEIEHLQNSTNCNNKRQQQENEVNPSSTSSSSDSGTGQADSLSTASFTTETSGSPSQDTTSDTQTVPPVCDADNHNSTQLSNISSPAADVAPAAELPPTAEDLTGSTSDTAPPTSSCELKEDVPSNYIGLSDTPAVSDPEPSCSRPTQSVYHIKWIKFRNESVPVVTQNENGPCPLIAVMNVLLLQGKVKLPPMMEMITSSQLMDYLGDCILEHAPKNITEDALLNYEQNMHDAMAVFHKLQTGLDVNVRFTGVSTFEYTSECIVFDLLEIPLHHGWLVDPVNTAEAAAVGNCSYNQLVEKIIAQKNSPDEDKVVEALVAEEFLSRTSHQLTYHGLSELASTVKDQELSVFFRNNHFSTLYKNKNELFLLVTDQGFLTESNVVWETLSNVEGDGHFVDVVFRTYRKAEPSTRTIPPSDVLAGSEQQIDQDYLVALSLQEEQQPTTQYRNTDWQQPPTMSDHELAIKLQEEENRRATSTAQRPQTGGATAASSSTPALPQTGAHPPRQASLRGTSKESSKKGNSDGCNIL